jgi:hypothetical protein
VSPDYDYTLSGFAVRTLLSVRAPLRRRAETFLDEIAADPFQEPDFFEMAPSGRKFSVFVRNDIVITLWLDHAEKEIRVVNVEFV